MQIILALQVLRQYSKFGDVIRNIQNKLGKRALKSDLKSTVRVPAKEDKSAIPIGIALKF